MGKYTLWSIVLALFMILSGGLIYIFYRSLSLKMFKWIGINESTGWFISLRQNVAYEFPAWFIYALPDGLWTCSYIIFIGTIWQFNVRNCIWVVSLIPIVGLVSEILQGMQILPGVFDWLDVIAYGIGWIGGVFYLKFIQQKILKMNKYEKIMDQNM